MNLAKKVLITIVLLLIFAPRSVSAQTEISTDIIEGQVTKILDSGQETFLDELVPYQKLQIEITQGNQKSEKIEVKNSSSNLGFSGVTYQEYRIGDKLKIAVSTDQENQKKYAINGYVKKHGLIQLILLFAIVVILVGRIWGAMSLVGLAASFLVIFNLIVPLIIGGTNPIFAAVLGSLIIIPTTFYISHGFNKKTHVGVAATLIGLIITGLLALYFVEATHLTGFASEEAGFLSVERQGKIDIRGILLAGIIIGTLGILDDVTIGQSSTVEQLKIANNKMKMWDLFANGMKVGQDHISSMVNTLVLVYSGSALPLLLLFFDSDKSFAQVLEFELISEEIVRMLVGSIGLVLAAPLSTILAAYVFAKEKTATMEKDD